MKKSQLTRQPVRREVKRGMSRRRFMTCSAASLAMGVGGVMDARTASDARPFPDYLKHDAIGLAELIRRKEVKAEELLEGAIKRVEELNPQLNAVVTKMYDEARKAIHRGLPNGPLRGVPFLLKDLSVPYAGVRYTMGSRLFAEHVAGHDSELVKRYKGAGLVICGRTNTPEFGLNVSAESVLLGPARNPWDTERSTGGSSGGSAAAVAARMVPMAH